MWCSSHWAWFGIANISGVNAKDPDTVIADIVIQQWQVLIWIPFFFIVQILKQSCTEILTVEPSSVCVNRKHFRHFYSYQGGWNCLCVCVRGRWFGWTPRSASHYVLIWFTYHRVLWHCFKRERVHTGETNRRSCLQFHCGWSYFP